MGNKTALGAHFAPADREYVRGLLRQREGETKIGAQIQLIDDMAELESSDARFVLLGIPEDIGVRANHGVGGAHTLWEPALQAFLNMQSTDACSGKNVLLLGAFRFDDWMRSSEGMEIEDLRSMVAQIDDAVYPLIARIVSCGKIPLVIGGGHNNAYPLLRGACEALNGAVNCINLDAHSDFRQLEGRHSGNPFSYALRDGHMNRYAVLALHRAYNSAPVLQELMNNPSLHYSFYEDIFLYQRQSFDVAISAALQHTKGRATGIELDLDCIAGVLSSAATPCGISTLQTRQYLHRCMREADVAYVHLTEGAVRLRDGRADGGTAKLVAYMLHDIVSLRMDE